MALSSFLKNPVALAAIAGLIISLSGNVIQHRSLKQRDLELAMIEYKAIHYEFSAIGCGLGISDVKEQLEEAKARHEPLGTIMFLQRRVDNRSKEKAELAARQKELEPTLEKQGMEMVARMQDRWTPNPRERFSARFR